MVDIHAPQLVLVLPKPLRLTEAALKMAGTSSIWFENPVAINSEIVGEKNQITGRGVMEKSPFKYRVSHLAVRIITTIHIVHLLLGYYPPYFQKTLRIFPQAGDIYWMLASSLLIPLYVGFETWWMF